MDRDEEIFEMSMDRIISELHSQRAFVGASKRFMIEILSFFHQEDPYTLEKEFDTSLQVFAETQMALRKEGDPAIASVLQNVLFLRANFETLLTYLARIDVHYHGGDPEEAISEMHQVRRQILLRLTESEESGKPKP